MVTRKNSGILAAIFAILLKQKASGGIMTVALIIDMPETVFSAIRKSPSEFAAEMRLAAAIKWYEMGVIL